MRFAERFGEIWERIGKMSLLSFAENEISFAKFWGKLGNFERCFEREMSGTGRICGDFERSFEREMK